MTTRIGEEARAMRGDGHRDRAVSPAWGPASIEGHAEEELAAIATLETSRARATTSTASHRVLRRSGAVRGARDLQVPVVGIAEASMLLACTVAHRFSVVTRHRRVSKPMLEDVVACTGSRAAARRPGDAVGGARHASATPAAARGDLVAAPPRSPRTALRRSASAAQAWGTLDRGPRRAEVGIPVIDGVACAVKMLEGLVGFGLGTSRRAAFMEPGPKELTGSEPFLEGLRGRIPAPSGVR